MTDDDVSRITAHINEALGGVAPAAGVEHRVLQRLHAQVSGESRMGRRRWPLKATVGNMLASVSVLAVLGGSMGIGLVLRERSQTTKAPGSSAAPATLALSYHYEAVITATVPAPSGWSVEVYQGTNVVVMSPPGGIPHGPRFTVEKLSGTTPTTALQDRCMPRPPAAVSGPTVVDGHAGGYQYLCPPRTRIGLEWTVLLPDPNSGTTWRLTFVGAPGIGGTDFRSRDFLAVLTAFHPAQPPVIPGAMATPAAIAYIQPESVSFSDAMNGWVLGGACDAQQRCAVGVARTRDAGATWTRVSAPIDSVGAGYGGLHVLASSPSDAWVWGMQSTGPAVFTASHDGGRTWQPVDLGQAVAGVAMAGTAVWAETGCYPPTTGCAQAIFATSAHGGSWSPLAALPASVRGPLVSNSTLGEPQLVSSSHRVWVLNPNEAHPALVRTDDAGHTWSALPLPCSPGETMALGASSDAHLLLTCTVIGGWPAPQEVWSSADAGMHWSLRSREGYSQASPPRPNVGAINNPGAPFELAVLSDNVAWMGNDRGDDLVTRDGGRTWTHAALPPNDFADGTGGITFADPQHGWTFAGAGLWATSDGGAHWRYEPVIGPVPGY